MTIHLVHFVVNKNITFCRFRLSSAAAVIWLKTGFKNIMNTDAVLYVFSCAFCLN